MDAAYLISYEEDGVYLEIFPKGDNREEFISANLMNHLNRKKIVNLNISSVQNLVSDGVGRTQIALSQTEHVYGEDLTVTVSGDEKEVNARLLAPEPNGPALDINMARTLLTEAGISHGIDDEALAKLLEAKDYGEPYVVARATLPQDGEDGKLIFHFSTDERTGTPREIGGGRVDYRSLDLFVPVSEGDLLVTRTAATDGIEGTTVKGNTIKQRPGKEIVMPRGKNVTVNAEKTEMHASTAGMVEYIKNNVNVSNVYTIKGDCDMSIGNIDFDGSVNITGSVRSGHTIKATNSITVGGGVEAAKLIAGGSIDIKGGMQGSGKGLIQAGGSVSIMYIEQGSIIADGSVKVDVCIHSSIETGGTFTAVGKRGAIIGGQVASGGDVTASFIGTLSHTKTEVEVGVMPRKRARLAVLEKEMERLEADKTKLKQLETYLKKTEETMDKETWTKLHLSGIENKRINTEDHKTCSDEISELKHDMEHATDNKIHVFETAFSGARVSIGSNLFKINNDISYATFKYSNGEVTYVPCEVSKTDIK